MTNTDKLDELYDKAFNSPESKIKYKLWMFKNNFNLCDGNFNELLKIYKIINTPIYMRESRQMKNVQTYFELTNLDMLRRISNYLSSAFSLVEYARGYMRENYCGTETMEIYENYIKEHFISNNLTKFIQDLRNFFLHNGINGFSYSFSFNGPSPDDIKFSTIIHKKDLDKGDYFTKKSKEYMSQLPEGIDIIIELQKYHQLVLELYTWLFDYLNKLHKNDIDIVKFYEREYFKEMDRLRFGK